MEWATDFGAPPLGPWRLCHYLTSKGQQVSVWDCNVSTSLHLPAPVAGQDRAAALAEAFVAAIEADCDIASYQWIGFSILSDTLPTTLGVIELLRRRYPAAKLVGGNHEATVNLQDCIGRSQLDAVILGDAEEPMLALMRGEEPSRVPGVVWRSYNPKPSREKFEEWGDAIQWGLIPYATYWDRTAALYDLDAMTPEERLDKLYEIHTVRIHSLVACELACTFSVAGDTTVFTEKGPLEIQNLVTGVGSVQQCVHGTSVVAYSANSLVATPQGQALATAVIDEGVRPVLRISVESGLTIKATPEHRFLCAANDTLFWKESRVLSVGDFIVVRRPERNWPEQYLPLTPPVIDASQYSHRGHSTQLHTCPSVLDEHLAWLAGFVVGDGCIPADGRPSVHICVMPELEAKQRELVRELFGVELKTTTANNTTKMRHGWIYSRLAREVFVQSLGMLPGEAKLRIPSVFWQSPKTVLAAFLDGLFDADGCIPSRENSTRFLTTVSSKLAHDVAYALLTLGVGCPNIQHINALTSDGWNRRDHYRVSVFTHDRIPCTKSVYRTPTGVWKWRTHASSKSIGLHRSTIRKAGLHHPLDRDGWYYMRVRSIESCLPERVYDITVPGVEAFIANGIVSHNCSVKNTRRIASGSMKPSIINLSPDALGRNLLKIKEQVHGVMTIYDSCDEAWLGRGRAEEYLGALESIKPAMDAGLPLGMRYLIQCRTNDLTEEIVARAGRVGVRHLTIGVESPVAQVRRDMKKPQSEQLVRDVCRWGVEADVNIYMLFIAFFPSITLEQLREGVANWREYMRLGATVSIEPFCMSYLGTDLADDPQYLTEYAGYAIPHSGTPAKRLKWATLIWPSDRRVCAVEQWVRANVDDRIEAARQRAGHHHTFKGFTGRVIVDTIEEALDLWDAGKLPAWEPGEGQRSTVYQDFGDQASGSEIAAAARGERRNVTASRFNSTHSTLDAGPAQGAVAGRVKDPALPHEMKPEEK